MERPWSTERDHPEEPESRRERAANAVDRYSLALQLIQVFPIVSQAAILMVATTWLARALSGTCLLLGTAWVVYIERTRMRRPVRKPTKYDAREPSAPLADLIFPVVTEASIAHGEDGKVHIAISLRLRAPEPSWGRKRRDVSAQRQIRYRSAHAGSKPHDRRESGGAVSTDGATPASQAKPYFTLSA